MRFGQAISALLAQYEVDTVFGIPGVHTLELFRDISASGIATVVPRHEQGAGFMADAYARITGKPGVCYLVTGPGALNALTPIAQAWHDSIPLLIIASTVRSGEFNTHRDTLHDTSDIAETLRSYTLMSENVTTPERLIEVVDEAFNRWRTERPRPVYIGVPLDVLVTRLAELLDAPVVTTGNAKGMVPTGHPLHAGVSLPFPNTQELVGAADLALALGTELPDFEYLFSGSAEPTLHQIIRVDIDPTATHPDQTLPITIAELATARELWRTHPERVRICRSDCGARCAASSPRALRHRRRRPGRAADRTPLGRPASAISPVPSSRTAASPGSTSPDPPSPTT